MRLSSWGAASQISTRYLAFKASGVKGAPAARAYYSVDGARMEAPLYCLEEKGRSAQIWVTSFPKLDSAWQSLEIVGQDGALLWRKNFSSKGFERMINMTRRLRPALLEQLAGIELSHTQESAFIEPLGVYPYDDACEVTRIHVVYPPGVRDVTLDPRRVLANATAEDAQVLECGVGDDGRHHITLSYRFPKNAGQLIFATPGGQGYLPWIFYLSPRYRGQMVQEFAKFAGDAAGDVSYYSWFADHRATGEQLAQQHKHRFAYEPLVSVVVPIYQAPLGFLKECVESVRAQSYGNWELVAVDADPEGCEARAWLQETAALDARVKLHHLPENRGIVGNTNEGVAASAGELVCFLDQDDLLEPDALFEYVAYLNEHPEVGSLYCDEDSFTEGMGSVFYPRLKPDYNPDALCAHNYVIHMLAARRSALEQAGLPTPEVEGAQDYDLTLRLSEVAPMGHVTKVLYHWRNHSKSINYEINKSKPYVTNAAIRALEGHFERTGVRAQVRSGMRPGTHAVTYDVPGDPLVSVIIPTKDHTDLLDACVSSLLDKAGWENLELLVVENNSTEPETFAFYDRLLARDERVRLLRYEGAFNYAKIINWAARQARGEYLLLLNNDTRALTEACVREMLGYFQRPEVGVVGPLLLFPDGLVQTAGLALMSDGRLGFLNQNLTLATHGGYLGSLECPRNCSAVLGAAQMVPKQLFDQLGGYDENLAVTYNDVDFCWRVREAGRVVTYTPNAQFSHREFATRGRDSRDPERAAQTQREAAYMRERWSRFFAEGDPVLNPGCDPASPWYKLPKE